MQNEKTLQQMIREYEVQMPKEIMDVISGYDWKRELREIVRINLVMLDVGADLEESVYLMILGAVSVEDMYERLVDIHGMPKEKAEKILYEIEDRIFRPLFERLSKANKPEEKPDVKEDAVPAAVKNDVSRDSILAEIEDDGPEVARPIGNIVMPGAAAASSTAKPSETPVSTPASVTSPIVDTKPLPDLNPISAPMSDRLGLRDIPVASSPVTSKPFSISDETAVDVNKVGVTDGINLTKTDTPLAAPVAQGIQADPISSGLTKSTVTSSPQAAAQPAKPTSYSADPYREPIE